MELAMKTWELDNSVKLVNPSRDALYNYDPEANKRINDERPWRKNPNHFTSVRISAVALIKMVMHARSGGSIEIMGLMQGYVVGTTLIITDAFRLPVEGTETRVNAHEDANAYMVEYLSHARDQGRLENAVGWYHSHPGYGCWLSGIDVSTQSLHQAYGDPFVAVVIDPERTISAGKVEIGAFRTYPDGYEKGKSSAAVDGQEVGSDGFQMVPMNKIEDFGAHSNRYYSLEVQTYKSTLDAHLLELLWHKYWVQTLSQSPLLTNREFSNKMMADLAGQTRAAANTAKGGGGMGLGMGGRVPNKPLDKQLEKIVANSCQIASKETTGMAAVQVRQNVFNGLGPKKA